MMLHSLQRTAYFPSPSEFLFKSHTHYFHFYLIFPRVDNAHTDTSDVKLEMNAARITWRHILDTFKAASGDELKGGDFRRMAGEF